MSTPGDGGQGQFNLGAYSNARLDELTRQIATETDPTKRQAMITEAFKIHADDIGHLPLHQQCVTWGDEEERRAGPAAGQLQLFEVGGGEVR